MMDPFLLAFGAFSTASAETTPWWSGGISALFGGIVGIVGAAMGILGAFENRGRGRRLGLLATPIAIALGGIGLVVGLVALLSGQPYEVYYTLLLGGGMIVLFLVPSHLESTRYGRRFLLTAIWIGIAIGTVSTAIATVAIVSGRSGAAHGHLFVFGLLTILYYGNVYTRIRRQQREGERREMPLQDG